eukprot:Gb_04277 [translate_table: standard]
MLNNLVDSLETLYNEVQPVISLELEQVQVSVSRGHAKGFFSTAHSCSFVVFVTFTEFTQIAFLLTRRSYVSLLLSSIVDVDRNGTIDLEELKLCFQELQVSFTDEEIKELHRESDMDESKGIDFKEFIVLLALVYLLGDRADPTTNSRIGLPHLEATFDTIVDTFVFFDKNGDGYVTKKEMVQAIHEVSPVERTADDIGIKRFREMDWNRNGTITFKEFLFAFTNWVGVEDDEDK